MKFVLQHVVFPSIKNIGNISDLYFKSNRKVIFDYTKNEPIRMSKQQELEFATYFNCFSQQKWILYTDIGNINLSIELKGQFSISLLHLYKNGLNKSCCEILSTKKIVSDTRKIFDLNFSSFDSTGILAFKITSLVDGSLYYDSYFYTNIDEQKIKNINLGIGICTYKREKYVTQNISSLTNAIKLNNCFSNLQIFIADNGNTLQSFNNDHIHLFKNRNTGGSGGFTRCMIEAINYNKKNNHPITHLILMDDDIIFDCESIFRTHAMLSILKDDYKKEFVGGAMFFFDKPYIQHASGEFWVGDRCESFIDTYNRNLDMRKISCVLDSEKPLYSNYQAWWYCAIPMSIVSYKNLPMPFFVKSDDIEYSIRNKNHTILLNGICVWHESFESKYSPKNEYYTVRNYLITASAHKIKLDKRRIKSFFLRYVKHYICNYKYLEIKYFCYALNDFLRGVDYVKSINIEQCHKVKLNKGYKIMHVNDLPFHFSKAEYWKTIKEDEKHKVPFLFAKYTINGLLIPSHKYAVLGVWGGSYYQTYRKKFLIRYDPHTNTAFILRRKPLLSFKSLLLAYRTVRKINKYFDYAYKDFSKNWRKLISYDNWKKHLS
ncbi:MAG: hypothetical protein MJ208_00200 [Bacilli bacterium]|nr:hypothetical protein [Bacilli bacterium]